MEQEEKAPDSGVRNKKESLENVEGNKKEGRELITAAEFLEQADVAMDHVLDQIDDLRDVSAEIRGMGARVTKETAQKILKLEQQRDAIEKKVANVTEFLALTDAEGSEAQLRITGEVDDMLTMEITDEMIVEMQPEMDLKVLEAKLGDEADQADKEMTKILLQMSGLHKMDQPKPKMPVWDGELRMGLIGILESRKADLLGKFRQAEKPESEMDDIDKYYARQRAEEYVRDQAEIRSLEKQIDDAKTITTEEVMATAANDEMLNTTVQDQLNESLYGVLQAQLNDVSNYSRVIKQRLGNVREDLNLLSASERQKKSGGSAEAPGMKKAA